MFTALLLGCASLCAGQGSPDEEAALAIRMAILEQQQKKTQSQLDRIEQSIANLISRMDRVEKTPSVAQVEPIHRQPAISSQPLSVVSYTLPSYSLPSYSQPVYSAASYSPVASTPVYSSTRILSSTPVYSSPVYASPVYSSVPQYASYASYVSYPVTSYRYSPASYTSHGYQSRGFSAGISLGSMRGFSGGYSGGFSSGGAACST